MMIQDWFRQNVVAVIVGTVIGGAAIGGSAVYIEQPGIHPFDAVRAAIFGPPAFPMRFQVRMSGAVGWKERPLPNFGYDPIQGERAFFCDLTRTAEMTCSSPLYVPPGRFGSPVEVYIQRYARDPSLVSIKVNLFNGRDGITWAELSRGVTIHGTNLAAVEVR